MNYLCLLVLFLFLPFYLLGQNYRLIQVCDPQTFRLSSFTKPNISGSSSSRKVLPVNLPYNTIKWFYSVSTCRQNGDMQDVQRRFNLFSELSKTIDRTGITSAVLSRMGEPPGSHYVDVYLLASPKDKDIFINKYSNLTSSFSYIENDSRTQIISGKVPVISSDYMTGLQYLGIRNTDATNNIDVCIQVVAIIQEQEQQSSYSSYNESQSSNDENSAGEEYRHVNLFSTTENTDNSTNTNVAYHSERINYANSPSPQNGWGSKEISELTGKYGDLYLLQLRENNQSVSHKFLIEFVNCMVAYIVSEYRYEYYLMLNTAERKNAYEKSSRHCISAMND